MVLGVMSLKDGDFDCRFLVLTYLSYRIYTYSLPPVDKYILDRH